MFEKLGRFIARRWIVVILFWVVLVVGVRIAAPRWEEVTHDGDFAYLPDSMPSVVGQELLSSSFPHDRAKSQIVIVLARPAEVLDKDDVYVGVEIARDMQQLLGLACLARANLDTLENVKQLTKAKAAFDEAVRLDHTLIEHWESRASGPVVPEVSQTERSLLLQRQQQDVERRLSQVNQDVVDSRPSQQNKNRSTSPSNFPKSESFSPLIDVWTWHDEVFGKKLVSTDQRARLVVLQLSREFMAFENLAFVSKVEQQVEALRTRTAGCTRPGLQIGITGSAAIGSDMLRSTRDSIKNTEWFTVVLVFVILVVVYRSPLLVAVPLVAIGISLLVALATVALLTQLYLVPGFSWFSMTVFTTTKIFVVVILFGAGTDYCLFLISRYRESLAAGATPDEAIVLALSGVGDALVASALTSIAGLGMMAFAEFDKFRYSGPVIGLCLAITLSVCLTLVPAVIHALGKSLFWPWGARLGAVRSTSEGTSMPPSRTDRTYMSVFWDWLALWITEYPGRILIMTSTVMLPLALFGVIHADRVTYDLLSEIPASRPTKSGTKLVELHFSLGSNAPIQVLLKRTNVGSEPGQERQAIRALADKLYLPGVTSVRCSEDPLGDFRPGEKVGMLSARARGLRFLRAHQRVQDIFVSDTESAEDFVARFEVIPGDNPFTLEAIHLLNQIDGMLKALVQQEDSPWFGAVVAYAGTTASIRDLRKVTQTDDLRIKVFDVAAVFIVLLMILRRPVVCFYLLATVLFSYFVTIGATQWFFETIYGETFRGLNWKVTIFLFVILVAIGQDYNVYLTTRIFEEQKRHGPLEGLRIAVIQTGGIITSCGVIMAGTFLAMTSGAWGSLIPPDTPLLSAFFDTNGGALRGIVELGFALTLGVLLDTFVVRSILVPAFLALWTRRRGRSVEEIVAGRVEN